VVERVSPANLKAVSIVFMEDTEDVGSFIESNLLSDKRNKRARDEAN
jgi:hypothetical protein